MFSLGVLLYKLLIGREPFSLEDLCAEHSRTPDLATLTDIGEKNGVCSNSNVAPPG